MKFFLITFSDYTETIGKQTSKSAMLKDARLYCKRWNLDCNVKDVTEITEAEYISRLR